MLRSLDEVGRLRLVVSGAGGRRDGWEADVVSGDPVVRVERRVALGVDVVPGLNRGGAIEAATVALGSAALIPNRAVVEHRLSSGSGVGRGLIARNTDDRAEHESNRGDDLLHV